MELQNGLELTKLERSRTEWGKIEFSRMKLIVMECIRMEHVVRGRLRIGWKFDG